MITGKKINELGDIIDPTLEAVLPIVKIKDGVADGTATKINLLNLVDFTFENRPENVLTNKNTANNNLVIFGDEAVGFDTILIGYNSKTGPESILIGGDAIGTQNSVCIGNTAQSSGGAIALGNSSSANGAFSISIGNGSNASSTNGVAIGNLTETGYDRENCIAIGYKAQSLGNNTYQIGPGTALVDNTLNVAFTYGGPNYTLLTGDGKIPKERLPDDIGGGGGTPTLTWYKNNTGSTITIDDTSSSSLVKVYKNGVLLEPIEDYTISGTTLTLTTELISTDKITTEVF